MNDGATPGRIRPIVICVFRNGSRILVGDAYDPTKKQLFYRPPGGGIRFGEPSEAALRREMKEELGVDIDSPTLLGVLENLFTYDGRQGHEVVFVYDAELRDKSLYERNRLDGRESNGEHFNALWLDLDTISPDSPPLYPDGLVELLTANRTSG